MRMKYNNVSVLEIFKIYHILKIPVILKCKISKSCVLLPIPSAIQFYTKIFPSIWSSFDDFSVNLYKDCNTLGAYLPQKYLTWECIYEEDKPKYLIKL